jgi:hypothetical protein
MIPERLAVSEYEAVLHFGMHTAGAESLEKLIVAHVFSEVHGNQVVYYCRIQNR